MVDYFNTFKNQEKHNWKESPADWSTKEKVISNLQKSGADLESLLNLDKNYLHNLRLVESNKFSYNLKPLEAGISTFIREPIALYSPSFKEDVFNRLIPSNLWKDSTSTGLKKDYPAEVNCSSILDGFDADTLTEEEIETLKAIDIIESMDSDARKEEHFKKIKQRVWSFYQKCYEDTKSLYPDFNQEIVKQIAIEQAIEEYDLWLSLNSGAREELEVFLKQQITQCS